VTKLDYDANGNVVKKTAYADLITAAEAPTAVVADASKDQVTRLFYDQANRVKYTVDATGAVTKLDYDANGNVVKKTAYADLITAAEAPTAVVADAAKDRVTSYEYDQAGRLTKTTFPLVTLYNNGFEGGTAPQPDALYTQTVYDAFGNAVVQRDTAGNYSYQAYDANNVLVMSVDQAGGVSEYVTDTFGRTTQLIRYSKGVPDLDTLNASWNGSSLSPVSASAIKFVIGPDKSARVIVTSYDQAGRATEVRQAVLDAGGTLSSGPAETINTYNAFGLLETSKVLKTTSLVLSGPPGAQTVQASHIYTDLEYHFYDQNGREVKTIDRLRYVTNTDYDAFGNVSRVTQFARAVAPEFSLDKDRNPGSQAEDRVTTYAYDLNNRVSRQTIKNANFWHLSGTSLSNTTSGDLASTFAYDAFGNRVQSTDALGRVTTLNFDNNNRVTKLLSPMTTGAGAAPAAPLTEYSYNAFGEMITERRSANGSVSTPTASNGYAIDEINGSPSDDRTTAYTYDT
jgi:YD repeat-containing protein